MNADDDTNLHPWIEPEIEARLTALVLGEASDFERDELERLIAERPELGLYRKRLEAMHRMLREVAEGESGEEVGEWRLAVDRREKLLAQLSGSPAIAETAMPPAAQRSPWSISPRFLAVAATIVIIGLMLGLTFPASTGSLRSKGAKSQRDDDVYAYETSDHVRKRMTRALDEGWESPVPPNASVKGGGEAEELALADRAIRLPAPTSATPAPSAEPMGVDKPGQIGALNGTVAIVAGGEIALGVDPNSPSKVSVTTSGNTSTNVRVGGDFDGRNGGGRSLAENPVTSTLGGENNYTGGTAITGGGVLAMNSPESPDVAAAPAPAEATNSFSAFDVPGSVQDVSNIQGMTINPSMTMSGFEFKVAEVVRRSAVPQQANAGKVEGEKSSQYEFGTTEVELTESSVPEIRRDLLPPQPSVPIARPRPATAAPASDPAAGEPALEQQVTKLGAGTLALNGGAIDLSLSEEIVEFDGFINFGSHVQTRDHLIRRELPVESGAFDKSKPSATANSGAGASTMDRSSTFFDVAASNFDLPGAKTDLKPNAQTIPLQVTESEVKREHTGDWGKAPVGKAPIEESVDLGGEIKAGYMSDYIFYGTRFQADGRNVADPTPGTVNFGSAVSQIENPEEFQKTGDANVALPGLQSDKQRFRFAVRAGSERKDAEVQIGEQWSFGRAADVDKSIQDILALTPQVGKDLSQDRDTMEMLYQVVPRIVGGGSVSGTRAIDSSVSVPDDDAMFPSLDDVIMRSDRSTPAALAETSPSAEPFSTFSLHVSDVSFQLAKSSLASGKWPEAEKIRIEEFVNAFDYGDPVPSMGERVACRIDQGAHPFLQQRNLVRIALRTAEAGRSSGTPLRLTLLLDSSGSMERPDRRATLTRAVATLAGLLGENDRITLVSFARQPRLVADAVAGNEAMKLAETVAALPSEGGTNLEAALELAFEKAREHQEANAQNRIVLLTDGAANLGDAKAESLGQRVEMMREAGIAFDAAGFGAEGLNDEILEALTRKGDGRYYLLDRPEDAGEAFAEQIAGALRPAAKNVKVQVEFNPDRVKSYKLLGFEKHRLATEDFRNDAVDAAELAAAEAGVAVYQVEPDPAGKATSVRSRCVSAIWRAAR
jgi:Mg-chelatase subunit ChlD